MRLWLWLISTVLALSPYGDFAGLESTELAWSVIQQRSAAAPAVAWSEAERELLRHITYEQLLTYLDGVPASEISLTTGESLQSFLSRKGLTGLSLQSFSIDSGGGALAGSGFVLEGTLGQPDAGALSGGAFSLVGGFSRPEPRGRDVFSDGFESGSLSGWTSAALH